MRPSNTRLCLTLTAATFGLITTPPIAAHEATGTPVLGKVQFNVDCNAAAQREFNLAMAYYHSFAWLYLKDPLDRELAVKLERVIAGESVRDEGGAGISAQYE